MIVYATGFDAITGSFDRIDIRGASGAKLKEKWRAALETFLGVHGRGLPEHVHVHRSAHGSRQHTAIG